MIVWTGWGILGLLLGGLGIGAGTGIAASLGVPTDDVNWGTSLGLILAAVAVWYLGQRLNRPVDGYHPKTGEPVKLRNRHTLFFIPMQYWALIFGAGSVVTGVMTAVA